MTTTGTHIINGIQVPDTDAEIRAWYTEAADLAAQYADDDTSKAARVARNYLTAARQAMSDAGLTIGPTGGRRRFGRHTPITTAAPAETPANPEPQTNAPSAAEQVTALRQAGRTVREIAEMIGVSISTIYRWARGICRPLAANAAALAALA